MFTYHEEDCATWQLLSVFKAAFGVVEVARKGEDAEKKERTPGTKLAKLLWNERVGYAAFSWNFY